MSHRYARNWLIPILLLTLWSGCLIARPAKAPPEESFGSHIEGATPDGRATIEISPSDSLVAYTYYPAVIDSVIVQPAQFSLGQTAVPVEALLKGAFPDACMQLHSVEQHRYEHLLDISLKMRRPKGALCAAVMRPYRFYLRLEGLFEPGSYTLKINGEAHSFVVRPPSEKENG